MKEALVIFAKAPIPGQVKTRLIGMLTAEQARELYICFLKDTFALMEAVQEERENLSLVLCYSPAEELEAFEVADLDGCLMLAQRGGNLGERLQNCFIDLAELGFTATVIIGADSPSLPSEIVTEAFAHLKKRNPIVVGPATDGGFYLIGMDEVHPQILEKIDWDTENTLSQLKNRAVLFNIETTLLPEWYDVDTTADLERLRMEIKAEKINPKNTGRYLRKPLKPS